MARTREDAFEEVIRKAAEIEFDEGNPKEIFDRIGLRPVDTVIPALHARHGSGM